MIRYFLADLRTGRNILDLPVLTGRWSDVLNDAESIDVTLDMQDPDTIALGLRNTASPGKTILAAAVGDRIMAAGPIWVQSYDRDSKTVRLSAKGMWSYFDHRQILPVVALTTSTGAFVVPDPSDTTKTMPNPALNTDLTNLSYGTIAKRWLQQAQAWTGGSVPVVFQDDEAGTFERHTIGTDFKSLGDALSQLTQVENGADFKFQPRFTADKLGIEFLFRSGSLAQPQLASTTTHKWDVTVPESVVSNLTINNDASEMASLAWLTGGRAADTVLVARSYDPTLVDFGYPLLERVDGSHSTVELQGTLDSYATEATLAGRGAEEVWSFNVEAAGFEAGVGDWCELHFAVYRPTEGEGVALYPGADVYPSDTLFPSAGVIVGSPGDPFMPEGGDYRRRIISLGGDEKGETVKIQCAPSRAA
ncbi:hypothetical protein QMG61_05210 [Cryobacterium sp. PH31-AA6]|uniref:hypothetical protein n=1 Tax=Cryobacterium sp. PH31-AA6 TaxID=3046205 RepID=UPI0024B959A2|nr:hypothetical protein [Cryobacterium sp. PH31-AA6]MDJ0323161.1 hypothetical protein [Cryobacterium sp. PH31-AA6]